MADTALLAALLLFAPPLNSTLLAQASEALPEYKRNNPVPATIRIWGSPEMSGVLQRWQQGFFKHQANIHFDDHLYGTASSIAGIYTGRADLSLLGRDIWPIETMAFETVFRYKPIGFQVATGSYDIPKATYVLVLYVNRMNPVSKLTLQQVAGIFGVPLVPETKAIRTWGDLGVTGEWSRKPIHTYNYSYENDKAVFFRRRVFMERYRWKDTTEEISNQANADGTAVDSGKLILDALAKDPFGIGVSNPHYVNQRVKPLALAEAREQYVFPSKETVQNRTYPLTRAVYVYVNHDPRTQYDPKIRDFLRYILSTEGQQDVTADGTYLPLPGQIVRSELDKLH